MPGAGSGGAGIGGAGLGPRAPLSPAATTTPPALARAFDPATRTFVQDGAGGFVRVHPVDQKVALALGVQQKSLASAADVGNRLRTRLARAAPEQARSIAKDEVRLVLKDMLLAGDIELLDVAVDTSVRGTVAIAVSYVNLRDPKTNRQNTRLSAKTTNLVV